MRTKTGNITPRACARRVITLSAGPSWLPIAHTTIVLAMPKISAPHATRSTRFT